MLNEQISLLLDKQFPTRLEAAKALSVSAAYISDVCQGKRRLSAELAARLVPIFGRARIQKLLIEQTLSELDEALQ